MKHYSGDRLYIALAAGQVRRRLKGHGFGVKKIHSGGRGQAVVIHTATGEHLRQLMQLFADVHVAQSEAELARLAQPPPTIPVALTEDGSEADG